MTTIHAVPWKHARRKAHGGDSATAASMSEGENDCRPLVVLSEDVVVRSAASGEWGCQRSRQPGCTESRVDSECVEKAKPEHAGVSFQRAAIFHPKRHCFDEAEQWEIKVKPATDSVVNPALGFVRKE